MSEDPVASAALDRAAVGKLSALSAEITEGLANLGKSKRWLVETEIHRLQDEADKESYPQVVYNILLFRKYCGVANSIQDSRVELEEQVQFLSHASLLERGTGIRDIEREARLTGWQAIISARFRMRMLAGVFALISFLVMASVPEVDRAYFHPGKTGRYWHCMENFTSSAFDMRPYRFVIAVGVMMCIHTVIALIYYVMPVDENNDKYVPGVRWVVDCLLNDDVHVEDVMYSFATSIRFLSQFIEVVADSLLLVLGSIAFLVAAIMLSEPVRFYDGNSIKYFTMESFSMTYYYCGATKDQVPRIRASIAMLFFALVTMVFCLQTSWRAAKHTHNTPAPAIESASDISNPVRQAITSPIQPASMEEGRVAPVRTVMDARSDGTLQGKLRALNLEMSEETIVLSRRPRADVEIELRRLKDVADKDASPDAAFALLLFRKYADVANELKDSNAELEKTVSALSHASGFDAAAGTIDGESKAKLAGYAATRAKIFWLRVVAGMFGFISFIIMACLPYVGDIRYNPSYYCNGMYIGAGGHFDMRAYQFALAAGLIIFVHAIVTCVYYLIPADKENRKYCPGLVVISLRNPEEEECIEINSCVRRIAQDFECVVDLCSLTIGALAFLLTLIALNTPMKFWQNNGGAYFSLETFYMTVSYMCPSARIPVQVPLIRASLAMLFFALVAMFVCFQVSWRASRQNQSVPETSSNAPSTTPGGEAYVPFSLPTSEEAGEGSDEEVAVEFHRTPPRLSYAAQAMNRDPSYAAGNARDHRLGRAVAAVGSYERKSPEQWEETEL